MKKGRRAVALSLNQPEAKASAGPSRQDGPLSTIRLFSSFRLHIDRHIFAAKFASVKAHAAHHQREQRVILAHTDIGAGIDLGTALADDDVAAATAIASSSPCCASCRSRPPEYLGSLSNGT